MINLSRINFDHGRGVVPTQQFLRPPGHQIKLFKHNIVTLIKETVPEVNMTRFYGKIFGDLYFLQFYFFLEIAIMKLGKSSLKEFH